MEFVTKLRVRQPLKGTLLTTPSPEIAEAISYSRLDWVFIDTEHSAMSIGDAQNVIRALAGRIPSLIRLPDHTSASVTKALDTGCNGIIAPQICTAEQTRALVSKARYAPQGERSVGIARAQKYGSGFKEYMAHANDQVAIIAQIENREAVENIADILAVPGLDAIFIGPFDLSASLGVPGQITSQVVQDALEKIYAAAKLTERAVGIFCPDVKSAREAAKKGASLIAVGIDLLQLISAVNSVADEPLSCV